MWNCRELTLGPSFRIDAQAKTTLATGVNTSIGIHYHVDKVQLVFPHNKKAASCGTFQVDDTRMFRGSLAFNDVS